MPSKPTPPDRIAMPPDITKLQVGGERPERAQFGNWGSKWQPLFDKVTEVKPGWVHWAETKPCEDHVRYSDACERCVKISKNEAAHTASSIKSAAEERDDLLISYRRNEIWVRAFRDDEIGTYVDPEA